VFIIGGLYKTTNPFLIRILRRIRHSIRSPKKTLPITIIPLSFDDKPRTPPLLHHDVLVNQKYVEVPETKQFLGMIGPNLYPHTVKTLFDLFTGDGIIQGIFINGENITFTSHIIDTEKRIEENKIKNKTIRIGENMVIPEQESIAREGIIMTIFRYFLYLIGLNKTNNLGSANTSIIPLSTPVDENTTAAYALFERDKPYLLHFYHNTSTISTIGRMNTPYCLSGHSKKINTSDGPAIETIDYHIFSKRVMYYIITENLTNIISEVHIKTKYIPVIHDFLSTKDYIVIVDSPLVFDFSKLICGKLPIRFDKTLPTFIHLVHKNTGHITTYKVHSSFYVFHFAKYIESYNQLEIYAPLYDDIDFDNINISGKYRKIVIDRAHKTAYICNNIETEKYNLDFPVEDTLGNIILRNIERRKINGFVKVNDKLAITQKWMFNDIFFCGEPLSIRLNNKNGLMAFGNRNITQFSTRERGTSGGIILLNMEDGTVIEYVVPNTLTIGFHTINIKL
jgi:hypothetical protein